MGQLAGAPATGCRSDALSWRIIGVAVAGIGTFGPIFQEETIGWVLDNYGYRASLNLLVGMAILAVFGTVILARRCRRNLASL
jgi:hypothetical protein